MTQTTQDKRGGIWTQTGGIWGAGVPTYTHGSAYIFYDPLIGTNIVGEKAFAGGDTGLIESLSVGASPANTSNGTNGSSGWFFTFASTAPTVYNDSTRGKVLFNNYGASMTDLDATKGYAFASGVPEDTDLYYSRWVRGVLKTTAGADFPPSSAVQWKFHRPNFTNGVSDDSDTNTGQELFSAISYNSNGRQVRTENNAGLFTGTATSGTANSFTDSTANWGVNMHKNKRLQLTHGVTNSFGVVASNTPTTVTLVGTVPTVVAGDTYSINLQQDFYGSSGLVPAPNSGWFHVEQFIHTSHQGVADGSYTIRYRQNGVIVDDVKSNIPIYGGTKRFFWMQAQDYFGGYGSPMTLKEVYSDDIFTQYGSTKRVVITDNVNVDLATVYEVQNWTTWTGGVVSGTINKGAITSGNYYVCVVTGPNTVLWSSPITLT